MLKRQFHRLFIFLFLLLPGAAYGESTFGFGAMDATSFASLSPSAQLLLVFLGGIASSFTPCVYPLIPITLALFGATAEASRLRAFSLSLLYVLGIAATYTGLGIVSAVSGSLFGSYLGNPYVVVSGIILLVILGLCCLDVIPFRLNQALQQRCNQVGGKGYFGAFLMGAVSGVIAAPCIGPILVLILGVAAASQQVYWGAVLLFVYSMGLGMLFLLLGTFSGLLSKIPRCGSWLLYIKFLLAVAILMVAVFLSASLRPPFGTSLSVEDRALILTILGTLALCLAMIAYKIEIKFLKFLAALLLAFSLFELFVETPHSTSAVPAQGSVVEEDLWKGSLELAIASAKKRNTIAMIDLFAEWCGACKELDAQTFSNAEVKKQLAALSLGRVDFTTETEATLKIQEQFSVIGLPCILFLRADGSEIPDSRITGFLPPKEFLEHLNSRVLKEKSQS